MNIFKFVLLFAFSSALFSFETRINYFQEDGKEYEVLHIKNDESFFCKEIFREDRTFYICTLKFASDTKISPKISKFFDIRFINEKLFKIYVYSKYRSKVFSVDYDLLSKKEITSYSKKRAKHWTFMSSSSSIETKQDTGIHFPIIYNQHQHPYIGTLDSNNEPIGTMSKTVDIKKYLAIKKLFQTNKLYKLIKSVNDYDKNFPNTLFSSELKFYKIVSTSKLLDVKDNELKVDLIAVINEAKLWLRNNPSNHNYTQILYIVAKLYRKLGANVDASYFINILLSEHPQDKFSNLSHILRADILYGLNKKAEAIKIYKKVLYSTKYIDVASKAAMILTLESIKDGNTFLAKEYFSKILNSNEKFLLQDKYEAYKTAKLLAENSLFELAAKLGEKLLLELVKKDEIYEELLKNIGVWWYKNSNTSKAYTSLSSYVKKFEYGEFIDEVQKLLDMVLFDINENNSTKRLKHLDSVLQKYDDKEISKKAKRERLLLFYKMKKYEDVLKEAKIISLNEDLNKVVKDSSIQVFRNNLKQKNCKEAIDLQKDYNITMNEKEEKALYLCHKEFGLSSLQQDMIKNYLASNKLQNKLFYLKEYVQILYNKGEFKKAKKTLEDVIAIESFEDASISIDTYLLKANILVKLSLYEELLKTISKIEEKKDKEDVKLLDIYYATMLLASKKEDTQSSVGYATKIINIQKRKSLSLYSPKVEFTLIESLKKLNKIEEASKVVESILRLKNLSEENRLRALYNASEIFSRLNKNDKAKEYIEMCTKKESKTSWYKLCLDYKNLL